MWTMKFSAALEYEQWNFLMLKNRNIMQFFNALEYEQNFLECTLKLSSALECEQQNFLML